MNKHIWAGLDVHLDSVSAAILEGDAQDPEVIKLSGDLTKIRRLSRRRPGRGTVRSCYEASGCGFVLQLVFSRDGFPCEVIAPPITPSQTW